MDLRGFLFRVRGVTPVPFIVAALAAAQFHPQRVALGALLAVAGEMLRLSSLRYAGGATRTRQVGAPALVTDGPYAVVRNPLYLANILIYIGYALASGALFPYLPVAGVIYFSFQYGMIISLEEQTLRGLFGAEFREYCREVPRLCPRLPLKGSRGSPRYSLGEALQEERRTLQSFSLAWGLLAAVIIIKG